MSTPGSPRTIGRYELVAEMAPSHLGPLWLVRAAGVVSETLPAATRRVRPGIPEGPVVDLIAEAAWTAMEVSHPLIPAVVEVVVRGSEIAVVQDYVEAVSLRSLQRAAATRRQPIPPAVGLRLVRDLAEALSSLHGQAGSLGELGEGAFGGFTPDSVLTGTDGRAHLLDTLVAGTAVRSDVVRAHMDRVAYTAPERLDVSPDAPAEPPADVFALGVLLWELIADRRLFVGAGPGLEQKVRSLRIPRLDELGLRDRGSFPEALAEVVAQAVDRDPSRRQQDVAEFIAAIGGSGAVCGDPSAVRAYVEEVGTLELRRQRDALGVHRDEGPLSRHHKSDRPPGYGVRSTRPETTPRTPAATTPVAATPEPPATGGGPLPRPMRAAARSSPGLVGITPLPSVDQARGRRKAPRSATLLGLAPPKPEGKPTRAAADPTTGTVGSGEPLVIPAAETRANVPVTLEPIPPAPSSGRPEAAGLPAPSVPPALLDASPVQAAPGPTSTPPVLPVQARATPPDAPATPPDAPATPPDAPATPPDAPATPPDAPATPPDAPATPPNANVIPTGDKAVPLVHDHRFDAPDPVSTAEQRSRLAVALLIGGALAFFALALVVAVMVVVLRYRATPSASPTGAATASAPASGPAAR